MKNDWLNKFSKGQLYEVGETVVVLCTQTDNDELIGIVVQGVALGVCGTWDKEIVKKSNKSIKIT